MYPLSAKSFPKSRSVNFLFYTGACGQLSENLPSEATFHTYRYGKKQSDTRTYRYKMDSEGYPVSVEIDGEGEARYSSFPVKMLITWGQSNN